MYATQSDIEDIFGKDNVAIWSNLDGETGADTTRIARAITYAEENVENRFRSGKYALPFNPIPAVVVHWVATLAGLWLFENRPDYKNAKEDEVKGFKDMRDALEVDIEAYVSGQRQLASNKVDTTQPSSPVVII